MSSNSQKSTGKRRKTKFDREKWLMQQLTFLESLSPEKKRAATLLHSEHTAEDVAYSDRFILLGDEGGQRAWVYIAPQHPLAKMTNQGWELRSRLVFRLVSGIYRIPDGCEVHHKNEKSTDDRPENLQLWSRENHREHHNQRDRNSRIKLLEGANATVYGAYLSEHRYLPRLKNKELKYLQKMAQAQEMHEGCVIVARLASILGMTVEELAVEIALDDGSL